MYSTFIMKPTGAVALPIHFHNINIILDIAVETCSQYLNVNSVKYDVAEWTALLCLVVLFYIPLLLNFTAHEYQNTHVRKSMLTHVEHTCPLIRVELKNVAEVFQNMHLYESVFRIVCTRKWDRQWVPFSLKSVELSDWYQTLEDRWGGDSPVTLS